MAGTRAWIRLLLDRDGRDPLWLRAVRRFRALVESAPTVADRPWWRTKLGADVLREAGTEDQH